MLTKQVKILSGNELSIFGARTELTSELAVITQKQDAGKDRHRLFWVKAGALILAFVRLKGGRVSVSESYDRSLPGFRACTGGLVYVGNGSKINNPAASLNATRNVVFQDGKAGYGGGLAAYGSESTIWIGVGSEVKGNWAKKNGGGVYLRFNSTLTTVNSVIMAVASILTAAAASQCNDGLVKITRTRQINFRSFQFQSEKNAKN